MDGTYFGSKYKGVKYRQSREGVVTTLPFGGRVTKMAQKNEGKVVDFSRDYLYSTLTQGYVTP